MKIAVCIKRVPDTEMRFAIAANRTSIEPAGLKFDLSDFDGYAVEVALRQVEKQPPGGVRGSPDSCIATARQPSSDSTQSAGLLQKGGVSTWRSCSSSWCRMSPRRRPFVVNLSNHGGAAHIDSRAAVWVGVASAIVVVALFNALDLCDSRVSRTLKED